jgi:hypothetical protein
MAEDRFAEGYAVGKDSNCCYPAYGAGGGFGNFLGGDLGGIIALVVVASLFGNGNFGFGGNRSNCATQADLAAGFANSEIMSDLNNILLEQSRMQNFINQGFAGVNATVTNGFAGVNNALCTLGYQNAQLVNNLSHQISDCCCTTQRAIDSVKYENERNTCNIIQAINAGNQRLVDIYTADKLDALRAENTALRGRISDDYQADRIISKLSPCPSPAYIVPNPNCCYNYGVYPAGNCGGASVQ